MPKAGVEVAHTEMKRHYADVHSTGRFRACVCSPKKDTHPRQNLSSNQKIREREIDFVDSRASLEVMGYSSLTPKEKNTIRITNKVLVRKTANKAVESNTEAKVFFQVLGAFLYSKPVDDSLSTIFLRRFVNEMGYTHSWEPGQTPSFRRGRGFIECNLHKMIP